VTWIEYSPFFMMSQCRLLPTEAGEELCQSAAHSVNASGCP